METILVTGGAGFGGSPEDLLATNLTGTTHCLEACRRHKATLFFLSTSRVYPWQPIRDLPFAATATRLELDTRWELNPSPPWHDCGIDEAMSIDASKHSLFGASKVAADVLVQEYGRYFSINTACFRGGCLTGPAHSGAQLHGFLNYLMRCGMTGTPYTVFGYKGKQVRDNIHAHDLVSMFWHYIQKPRPGEVYNAGGSRFSNCSMLAAIALCEEISDKKLSWTYTEINRIGDHIWWISDVSKIKAHHPDWSHTYDVRHILQEMHDLLSDNGHKPHHA